MIIGIDGNEANVPHMVGVSVYTQKLLEYFQSHSSAETQFIVFLRTDPLSHLPPATDYFRYEVVPGQFLWSQIFFPLHLAFRTQIDVLFSPAHYSPRWYNGPLVVTIHDLSYYQFPQEFLKKDLYKLTYWTAESVQKAEKIIAVSKTTKKDIGQRFQSAVNKTTVIYNGFEKPEKIVVDPTAVLSRFGLQKHQFLLFVGTLQPRKNVQVAIRAMKKILTQHPKFKLVIVGKKGWLYEDMFRLVELEQVGDAVIFTDYLPDEDVVVLYKTAFCFVHPSLYEGFGIPILEAMSYDCPVICSRTASLPEIGGDACMYFDPQDPDSLVQELNKLIASPSLRKELRSNGKKRIALFSWEQTGQQTLHLLQSVVS
jgi:glycosyltransferase involved in cell wall biosynthesis